MGKDSFYIISGRFILYISFYCILSISVYSQKNIKGRIINISDVKPVSDVYVVAASINNKNYLLFARSDSNGLFLLKLDNDVFPIKLSFKKYGVLETTFNFNINDKLENLIIKLQIKIEDAIVVKSNNQVYRGEDTTNFIANKYRTGTEASVKDLLDKMPNIVITNGKLYFKGKLVSEVQIENDNVLGENYSGFINNFGDNGIEAFQFIENYIDSFDNNSQKKTILNIKYKKFKRLFSTNTLGLNYNFKYGILKNDFIKLNKKNKTLAFVNANNLGQTTLNNVGIANENSNLNAHFAFARSTNYLITPLVLITNQNIPNEKLSLNKSVFASLSLFNINKKKTVTRNNISFGTDVQNQQFVDIVSYNTLPFNEIFNRTFSQRVNSLVFYWENKIQKNIGKNSKFISTSKFNIGKSTFQANGFSNSILNFQQTASLPFGFEILTQLNKPNKFKSKQIHEVYFNISKDKNNYFIDKGGIFLPFINSINNTYQQHNSQKITFGYFMETPIKIKSKTVYNSFTFFKQLYNFNSKVGYNTNVFNVQNDSSNKLNLFVIEHKLQADFNFTKNTKLAYGLKTMYNYISSYNLNKTAFLLLPSLQFNTYIAKTYRVLYSIDRTPIVPKMSNIYGAYVLTGVNGVRVGSPSLEIGSTYNNFLNIDKYSQKKAFGLFLISNISSSKFTPLLNVYTNILFNKDSIFNSTNTFTSFYMYKSYFRQTNTFTLTTQLSAFKNLNFLNGFLNTQKILSPSLTVEYVKNIPKQIYFKASLLLAKTFASNLNKFSEVQTKVSSKAKFIYNTKKLLAFELNSDYFIIESPFKNRQQNLLLDLIIKTQISKKAKILLEANNVLNVKFISDISVSNNLRFTNAFYLFPQTFVIKCIATF